MKFFKWLMRFFTKKHASSESSDQAGEFIILESQQLIHTTDTI